MTVLEDLHMSISREAALDALRELHGAMMRIVVAHESAHKSDHDTGRYSGLRVDGGCSLGSCGYGCGANQDCKDNGKGAR